ncbi:MAG: bifunctional 4-hydroxy-2-oxoglutarate aldolase/2-dehydro-3-deoxy-phosphogluconate aldolase [Pseudomonadota bacterium]
MSDMTDMMKISPVIPVVVIQDVEHSVPLANALLAGGIKVIEITLRSDAAIASIEAIAQQCPDMCVGAGTVWTEAQANAVIDAGVSFIVSPGISMPVFDVCKSRGVAILPGAQTTSEVAQWVALGLDAVKFFPAQYAGGVNALKAFSAVFPGLYFCPTGGINLQNAEDYLALSSVACVGGSWIVNKDDVAQGNWSAVTEAAAQAVALQSGR